MFARTPGKCLAGSIRNEWAPSSWAFRPIANVSYPTARFGDLLLEKLARLRGFGGMLGQRIASARNECTARRSRSFAIDLCRTRFWRTEVRRVPAAPTNGGDRSERIDLYKFRTLWSVAGTRRGLMTSETNAAES